jgi:transaldolase/glucose-6-phosphate isomerase
MPPTPDLTARWPALDVPARRDRLQRTLRSFPGAAKTAFDSCESSAVKAMTGLWQRDPAVWSSDPEAHKIIANRLGWLDSPVQMAESLERLHKFAEGIKNEGFTDAVLLGMGGSSLAGEVLRSVIGPTPGWLRLHVLDSTDPAAVLAVDTPVKTTLYILASKSGTTIEPNSVAAYFREGLQRAEIRAWSGHFIAITDAGTELATRARREKFRDVFINPTDIGGRYSALSFFGLVLAALMGQDLEALVGWGLAMLAASDPTSADPSRSGAIALGTAMAAGALSGRDKLTLVMPPALEAFGLWVEQLVAESTGKSGVGIIPIAGEMPLPAERYSTDRLFVRMKLEGAADTDGDALMKSLEALGAPAIDITMFAPEALGAEFVRWEIATAVAGSLLGINPFDEPNVAQTKAATHRLLGVFKLGGQMPVSPVDQTIADCGVTLRLSQAAREALGASSRGDADRFLTLLGAHDYFALLAYVGPRPPELASTLRDLRSAVGARTGAATTFGIGPRYLHSTGQLHKGGPTTGLFVVVSAVPRVDFPIPGESFSFGTLEIAQAIGDFEALDAAGRRALHVQLSEPDPTALKAVADRLLAHLADDFE